MCSVWYGLRQANASSLTAWLCHELVDRLRHRDDVVEDEEVRDQVMILDHFALFIAQKHRPHDATQFAERNV
jgi:hypothetical protein